jgi:AraC family transcriptional regulator
VAASYDIGNGSYPWLCLVLHAQEASAADPSRRAVRPRDDSEGGHVHGEARVLYGCFGRVAALRPGNDLVPHAHKEAHLVVPLADASAIALVCGRQVNLTPGVAVAVNPLEVHSFHLPKPDDGGTFLTFYINPDWLKRSFGLSTSVPFTSAQVHLDAGMQSVARAFADAIEYGTALDDTLDLEVGSFVETLISAAICLPRRTSNLMHMGRSDCRVRRAMNFMQQNLDARLTLEEVARYAGLSRPHFFSLFHEQTSMTPRIYWNLLRIEHALSLMRASEASLGVVACDLGFSSQGNFSRFFREHIGVSPLCYRQAML